MAVVGDDSLKPGLVTQLAKTPVAYLGEGLRAMAPLWPDQISHGYGEGRWDVG